MKSILLNLFTVVFSLAAFGSEQPSQIVWGALTNGYRAGVRIQSSFKSGNGIHRQTVLYFGTTNANTSWEQIAYVPPKYEIFDVVLLDAAGKEVSKTSLGKKYGVLPEKRSKFSDRPVRGPKRWQGMMPSAELDAQVEHFNLCDLFEMPESPSVYTLLIEVRVLRAVGDGKLQIERLPRCHVEFEVH